MDAIVEDLRRIGRRDRDELKTQFREQLSSPANNLTADDYAAMLFRCVDALSNEAAGGGLAWIPILDQVALATRVHKIADQVESEQDPQGWHSQIGALEQDLFRLRVLGLDGDVEALERRAGELSTLLSRAEASSERLDELIEAAEAAREAAAEAGAAKEEAAQHLATAQAHVAESTQALADTQAAQAQAEASEKTASKHEQEIETRRARVTEFVETIDEHATEMKEADERVAELEKRATAFLDESTKEREEFFESAKRSRSEYEREASTLLRMATGASLFKAFDKRKAQLAITGWAWAALSLAVTGGAIWFALALASEATELEDKAITASFWVKLATTPLFLLAIGFCVTQYAHVRRLEDTYAFKSTLSVSLEPYRDLVTKMLESDEERKHLEFVVETIRQIFASPDLRRAKAGSEAVIDAKTIRELLTTLGEIAARRV